MRTANYVFSVISLVLGFALILFMLTQTTDWNIGFAIGIVLILNGADPPLVRPGRQLKTASAQ